MELLNELLALHSEKMLFEGIDIELFEELGNLNKIDKGLIKLFKKSGNYNKKENGKVYDRLGRDSKIESFSDTHQNAAFARLEEPGVVALIVEYDGEQILAVVSQHKAEGSTVRTSRGEKPNYAFIIKPSFFQKILGKEEYEKEMGADKGEYASGGEFSMARSLQGSRTVVVGKIKRFLKFVFEAAKKNKIAVKSLIVTTDEERTKKTQSRAVARQGIPPFPTGNKVAVGPNKYDQYENLAQKHFRELGRELGRRLDSFKAGKAKSFDNPKELLEALIKEGYFDKVKFLGFTYKFHDDRIYFKDLKKKADGTADNWTGESYIEYAIQEGTPELRALQGELDKVKEKRSEELAKVKGDEKASEAVWAAYYEDRKKVAPPRTFKVILQLNGGVIEPKSIEIGKDEAWIF